MYYFLRYLYYPRPKFLRDKSDATRLDVVLFTLLLVVNIICSAVGVHNLSQAIRRTGLMTVINILPLAMGGHMNILVDRCKIGLRNYQQIHRSIGRVAILEGLVHSVIALISAGRNWHSTSSIAAIVAASALFAMLLTSLAFFMRRFYEVFNKLHLLLVIVLLRRRGRATEASVISMPGALLVCVKLSRPWDFRPGQYAYLSFPGLNLYEVFQSHPFFIAWWHRSKDSTNDEDAVGKPEPPDTAVFIIQRNDPPNSSTELTKPGSQLIEEPCLCYGSRSSSKTKVLIEGPYGTTLNIGSYGTVVMFATGIGIAAQMPYIKQLLKDQDTVQTRRAALYWEIEAEIDGAWVHRWMNELLKTVKRKKMLDIRIFVLGEYKTPGAVQGSSGTKGSFDRIKVSFDPMDAETAIDNEIDNLYRNLIDTVENPDETDTENPNETVHQNRNDGIIITMCVHRKMANQVRRFVATNLDTAIQLEELDFYPQWRGHP
uniref:Ferric/cupric reductase transmembrane component 2 n=1 Tax=Talaromyces marneffei PM1 TaxID=1077442 RepID=A0A093UXW8_TALMA